MAGLAVSKAHAYGNDFLFLPGDQASGDIPSLARRLCHRHHGVGADGLIVYELRAGGATMKLWNADGSPSELSGNGVRCLAALIARLGRVPGGTIAGRTISIETTAGLKILELLAHEGERYTFRAAMGPPADIRRVDIRVLGELLPATVLSVGNPQCVVLGAIPDEERFRSLGPALSTHPMFPAGTNVEFVHIERPDRIRMLIWERGVGPTMSSGTGASAAAVAAAVHGGAGRATEVVSPGGSQRVEWLDDGIYLTGWAEVILEGQWVGHANTA